MSLISDILDKYELIDESFPLFQNDPMNKRAMKAIFYTIRNAEARWNHGVKLSSYDKNGSTRDKINQRGITGNLVKLAKNLVSNKILKYNKDTDILNTNIDSSQDAYQLIDNLS